MSFYSFDDKINMLSKQAEKDCMEIFLKLEENVEKNQLKVLKAFYDNRVSESHFTETTGYGYGDRGREVLDEVFAQIVGAEDAIVRHSFVSGTHALTVALFGVLRPFDKMLCVTGTPYDTIRPVIGIEGGDGFGSLKDYKVEYSQVDLIEDKYVDYEKISKEVLGVKLVYIQRSRGYSLRPTLDIDTIEKIVKVVREVNKDAIIMVDNCYGEFVEDREPCEVGADIIVGSLIKNPGGGIAKTGGYIAGKKNYIELCANRLTAVGVGKEVGCSLGENKNMFMGLFLSPMTVGQALKSSIFASRLFELMGYEVFPKYQDKRSDIIQSVALGSEEKLIAFCQGVQKGAPIDSFVVPEAWDMPGYNSKVIMAAGAFNMGASIELSADAPLREPYAVYLQGGLTFYSAKYGIKQAAQNVVQVENR